MTNSMHFTTPRLSAVPISADHMEWMRRLVQDPRVAATLGGVPSEDALAGIMQRNLDHWSAHGFGIWNFTLRSSGDYVGRAGLRHVSPETWSGEIELAYAVMADYWRNGYATEMSQAVLRTGFEQLRLPSIVCFTLPHNIASRRVMEKLGFVYERDGQHAGLPHVFYRLTASRFDSHRG